MGRTQVPLGADGVQQIQKIAPLIATLDLDGIYTSPLRRAVQTAKVVAAETKLPICKSEGLNEIAYGEWAGRYFEDLIDDAQVDEGVLVHPPVLPAADRDYQRRQVGGRAGEEPATHTGCRPRSNRVIHAAPPPRSSA